MTQKEAYKNILKAVRDITDIFELSDDKRQEFLLRVYFTLSKFRGKR